MKIEGCAHEEEGKEREREGERERKTEIEKSSGKEGEVMTTRRWCEKVESYQREASKLGIGKSREPDVAERSSEMGPFGQLEWAASGTEQPTDLTTQDKKECEYLERERTLKGVEEEE
ncbi:hypothetical protein CIHG_00002 [Coccidioides immitis H538.4]|uniref:Uncharacterized protein n=1 Tax=Coccidioides immitis H538.4 TaxID=396776 RepID=A0A0J8RCI2_COCIT|nr:hypothetical protein CIHG_00002 [Coccidioides immitis H538.4]